VDIFALCDMRP